QIDPVHMWAAPNFPLVGRKVLMAAGLVDATDDARRLGTIFEFWSRATAAYRFGDGTHQASDAGGAATPYRSYVDDIVAACRPVTDFGTSITQPEDYWRCVDACAFFDVAAGELAPIEETNRDALALAAKSAQKQLYRKIAGMERRAKIDAGAYVYFTFLRPFAERAGVELDWTVPRDSLDLYPLLELVDGALPGPAVEETPDTYYAAIP